LDENGKPVYVLMSFRDYQRLVGDNVAVQQDGSPDDINDDIAAWKQTEKEENMEDWSDLANVNEKKSLNQANSDSEKSDLDQKYYFEPIE